MRLTSRLSISLILGVAAVSLVFAFYQTRAQSQSMPRDLREHSLILGDSLARAAEPLVAERRYDQLQRLVDRVRDRETVTGVAAYDAAGTPLVATTGLVVLLGGAPRSVWQTLRNGWASEEFLTAVSPGITTSSARWKWRRSGSTAASRPAIGGPSYCSADSTATAKSFRTIGRRISAWSRRCTTA